MDCRANSSEKLPLLLPTDREEDNSESYFPRLPEEILVTILSQLPLKDIASLARTSKAMNVRISDARSIYTYPSENATTPTHCTYRQVIDILVRRSAAKKRIAAIQEYNDESCYYVPPEDRTYTQNTEGVAIIIGVFCALTSCAVSAALTLHTSFMWPLLACGTGNAIAACPIGLGGASRFYTNRFNREDEEIRKLHEELEETDAFEIEIRRRAPRN